MPHLPTLCIDGSSHTGDIRTSLRQAFADVAAGGTPVTCHGCFSYQRSGDTPDAYWRIVNTLVNDAAQVSGVSADPANFPLLLVGKSRGAAKLYRMLYDNAAGFARFRRVAAVLVDTHDAGSPGDDGTTGTWHDCVYFDGGTYHLKWWSGRWGAADTQAQAAARLRVYAVYQRRKWPKGYAFPHAFANLHLTGGAVDHGTISSLPETIRQIAAAVQFAVS
jgi:hypothetical protein